MTNLLASDVGTVILSLVLAIIILLSMICVHEFGHFIAGRILKFKINEFAIGFGPAIFKRKGKRHGTVFSVRCFPLGGYCAFDGEEGEGDDSAAFNNQRPWKRIIVLISGALMNYLLALALIMAGYFAFGQSCYRIDGVTAEEGYAAEYCLQAGDVLLAAEGRNIYFAPDLMKALGGKSKGEKVSFTVRRGGQDADVQVALRCDCSFKNSTQTGLIWKALGADTYEEEGVAYWSVSGQNVRFSFISCVGRSFAYAFKTAGAIFRVLGELLTGSLGIRTMGGPITTIKLTSEIAIQGVQSFLQIAAYIGVNLAVFNLLPIPALDGSKVVFCLIEWIFKKPVPRRVEAVIHAAGLVLILAFAVVVDVLQFVR